MVNFEAFAEWAEKRFGDIVIANEEIKINSIFDPDDEKHKLWCSPKGGKEKRKGGVYHCFKTDKKGTLIGLVMLVDGCSYEDAVDEMGGDYELAYLEDRLNYFLGINNDVEPREEEVPAEEKEKLQLPEGSCLITAMSPISRYRAEAEVFLRERKIPIDGLFYCVGGVYKQRIIIPYYDRAGELIYFNGRHVWKSDPKYMGPPKELGIGKGDVVYMPKWPQPGEPLYLTEGEFDAKVLSVCGLNSAAVGGSVLSEAQLKMLQPFSPLIICGDNDEKDKTDAGKNAVIRISNKLMENGITKIQYVRAPRGFKDWNDLLKKFDHAMVARYVVDKKKPYTQFTQGSLEANSRKLL